MFFKRLHSCCTMPPKNALESSSTMYKYCDFFKRGECQRGLFCTFAHSADELGTNRVERSQLYKMTLCKFWDGRTYKTRRNRTKDSEEDSE